MCGTADFPYDMSFTKYITIFRANFHPTVLTKAVRDNFFTNKKTSRFVSFHAYQSLLTQIPTSIMNASTVAWIVILFIKGFPLDAYEYAARKAELEVEFTLLAYTYTGVPLTEKEIKKRQLSQRIEQLQHNDSIELQTAIETETATG